MIHDPMGLEPHGIMLFLGLYCWAIVPQQGLLPGREGFSCQVLFYMKEKLTREAFAVKIL